MRWPANTSLGAATPGAAKSGQLHRDLTEQRRDRMIAVILQAANTFAALAFWPPDDVVTRLRGGDFTLNTRQQQLRLGKGQPQVGDIATAIRPPDLHEVCAWTFAIGAGFHQPQNPRHAFTAFREPARKYQTHPSTPSFAAVPAAFDEASVILA
jgi:hypothetical protein